MLINGCGGGGCRGGGSSGVGGGTPLDWGKIGWPRSRKDLKVTKRNPTAQRKSPWEGGRECVKPRILSCTIVVLQTASCG